MSCGGESPTMSAHFVYVLECADGSLYTGWTTNVSHRLETHNSGRGAKYTRSRLPVVLRLVEVYESKSEALRREHQIKQMSRHQKQALIQQQINEKQINEKHNIQGG